MIAAALRAFYVEPKRSDKNLGAEVYFLLRFFDAVVWTTFTVGLPLLYLQLPFEIKNAVLWLGMLPMMVVVMFVWELETVVPRLRRELSSMRYRNILLILCAISILITVIVIAIGMFPLLQLLTILIPMFAMIVVKTIWENWDDFIWQLLRYVLIIALLALMIIFILLRYSDHL
jgi:hypothetical protein